MKTKMKGRNRWREKTILSKTEFRRGEGKGGTEEEEGK